MPKMPTKSNGRFGVRSHRELAELLNVAQRTVRSWAEVGMPGSRANWNLASVAAWLAERYRLLARRTGVTSSATGGEREDPRTECARWRAESERLRVERLRGDTVSRAEHERQCNLRSGWFVQVLDQLAPVLAPTLANKSGRQVRRIIARHVREIRQHAYGGRGEQRTTGGNP